MGKRTTKEPRKEKRKRKWDEGAAEKVSKKKSGSRAEDLFLFYLLIFHKKKSKLWRDCAIFGNIVNELIFSGQ